MTVLSGRVAVTRSRVPVRIEDPDTGRVLATTVTNLDGTWQVDVPPGRVVVAERWGRRYTVDVTGPADGPVGPNVGARQAQRIAAMRAGS